MQPMDKWIPNIRYEINQVLINYKNVYLHKAKTACLCGELNNVCKQVLPHVKMPTDSLSHVQNLLRQIIQHIHDLKDLFFELTEANHPRLLLEKEPNYVIDKLQNFRQNFNGIMKELKFVESDPCPIEDVQIKIDDLADTEDIINCLHKLIDIVPNEEDKNTYKSRLTFYEETRKKYKEEEEKAKQQLNEQNRIMTQEEINSEFTELSKYSLEYNDFELHKKIGFGAFAEVFLGYQKSTHKIVAIKKLHSNQFNRKNFEMFKREIKIIASVQHFAILPFVGACIKPPYCIITEYLSGGCLFERLRKGPPLDPTKHTIIALGIAAGMAHMHEKGMIHRDLKSLNILLDADDFPKICDFGMSREIAKEGEPPMSGSVGTVQWMAPEVIQCTAYGAKADVYSYGIILWELLTHDLPFQGLKEVQVAMTVINRDSRPIIPQSCPPKLSVLIKLCWDKDPSKRPDFTKIVQAFASGEVFYPGTNHEIVKAYLNQYMQTNTKTYHFNPEDATIESAQQIYDELSNNTKQEEGISKILLIKDYEKWYKYFLQLKIVEKLIDIMTKCQQVNFSFSLVLCLVELLQNKEIIQQFIECNGSNVLLDLFLKFGMTSMNRIIECLMIIIQNDKNVKLGIDHFTKLAPFLVSNDLIIRLDTMKLLVYVLENHVYDEDGSLTVLTLNVMCNAQPEAKPQILMITLKILKLLLELPKPFSFIIRADGPATIYVLLGKDKSEEIQIESLELIQKMLQNSVPPIKTISLFVCGFKYLIENNPNNTKLQLKALIILSILLKSSSIYKEVSVSENIMEGIKLCLSSNSIQVIIYTLKICFAFLSNFTSFNKFKEIGNDLIPLLVNNKENGAISNLAASCLIIILSNSSEYNQKLIQNGEKEFPQFIKNSFKSNNQIEIEIGLRLLGVISSTFSGALLIEKNNLINDIISFKDNNKLIKLIMMTLASHASSYPLSKSLINLIPFIFEALSDEKLSPYPLLTIVNIVVNPLAAMKCVSYMDKLIKLMDVDEKETKLRAFNAIHRILIVSEACEKIVDENLVKSLIEKCEKACDGEYAQIAYEILEAIAENNVGKKELEKSKVRTKLEDGLEKMIATDPLRPVFMRLYARMGI